MAKERRKVVTESVITFVFFLVIGIWLWLSNDQIFFLFNFGYIGLAVASGELLFGILPREKKVQGRKLSQLLVGLYMLCILGLLGRENMQIEGFFFYLLAGVFSGPVIHYAIAKIGGTFLFGRGWCGWACWTAMVLDFLPWVKPGQGRLRYWGALRYAHFALALSLVLLLWYGFQIRDFDKHSVVELNWLLIGNFFYFAIGITLAAVLKDNRAFCKYVCPIPVVMKAGAPLSMMKIEIDGELCSRCGKCERHCPMNIKLLEYMKKGHRVASTECIVCQQCVNICPEEAVRYSRKFDGGCGEHLNFRKK